MPNFGGNPPSHLIILGIAETYKRLNTAQQVRASAGGGRWERGKEGNLVIVTLFNCAILF